MNTLPTNFTSQKVYKYGKEYFQSIKLPNIRNPYRSFYLGLSGVSDAQIDALYAAFSNHYGSSNQKQEILNILAAAPYKLQRMFQAALDEDFLVSILSDALEYMLDVAKKDFKKENATPRDINTYKRLSVIDWTLHFGNVFAVLNGSVTDHQGFKLTDTHINGYGVSEGEE
tara:strand:- start:46 stop:558 length:513 start_codon:yes stop_codon:yes gene_type:complete